MTNSIFSLEHSFLSQLPFLSSPVQANGLGFRSRDEISLIWLNYNLVNSLGLSLEELESEGGKAFLTGWLDGLDVDNPPVAQAYAGHQFGHYSPLLGDGRAMLLGELEAMGSRWDIHAKGTGRTVFSRRGDGLAPLDAMLKEVVFSVFFKGMEIPATQALAVLGTGQQVRRHRKHQGAVLVRVARSHLRVGTFQLILNSGTWETLDTLFRYALWRHEGDWSLPSKDSVVERQVVLDFFKDVVKKQSQLVAKWMASGFIHGVMNTDNVLISGETIDFGPCGMLDAMIPDQVYSSIDQHGRYRYDRQFEMMLFNLSLFADCLIPLMLPELDWGEGKMRDILSKETKAVDAVAELFREVLQGAEEVYERCLVELFLKKLGLKDNAQGLDLMKSYWGLMAQYRLDFAETFRLHTLYLDALKNGQKKGVSLQQWIEGSCEAKPGADSALSDWYEKFDHVFEHLSEQEVETLVHQAKGCNPMYIPRNKILRDALSSAENGDLKPFETMVEVLTDPCQESQSVRPESWLPRLEDAPHVTFCGT